MNYVAVNTIDNFADKLVVNIKGEKIREFLRFKENPKYFELDTHEEVLQTKNVWAFYAYLMLIDSFKNEEISDREKSFLDQYYNHYLLETNPTDLEKDLKNFYLKHRLTKDYKVNDILDQHSWVKHDVYESSFLEFSKTIECLLAQVYDSDIKLEVLDDNFSISDKQIFFSSKDNVLVVRKSVLEHAYLNLARADFDTKHVYEVLTKCIVEIEYSRLNKIKKNEVSTRALIYTIEDYLYSKTLKSNKVARVYGELFNNMLCNRQITIDCYNDTYNKLLILKDLFKNSEYDNVNKQFDSFLEELRTANMNRTHFYNDARFFDTNNSEDEGLSKVLEMYIKGLKAMPKSMLTNVTKYVAINGERLNAIDLQLLAEGMRCKIDKSKDEDKKEKLNNEYQEIKEVIRFIKEHSVSYQIEERLLKDIVQGEGLSEENFEFIFNNQGALDDCLYSLTRAYNSIDGLASSGSPSKVSNIRYKQGLLKLLIETVRYAKSKVEDRIDALEEEFDFVTNDKELVINKVKNRDKLIATLQELTGRGILTVDHMINDSLNYKTPVMKDLTPGFKDFVEDILSIRGAPEFKKKKSK